MTIRQIGQWLCAGVAITTFLAVPVPAIAVCGDSVIDVGEDCDEGDMLGGDGCSASCTFETLRAFDIDPVQSFALTQLQAFGVRFTLTGRLLVVTGRPSPSGFIHVVIREKDLTILPVAVPGLVCACPLPDPEANIFPFPLGEGIVAAGLIDCGNQQPPISPLEFPLPTHVTFTMDHNTNDTDPECAEGEVEGDGDLHPGVCNGPLALTLGPRSARGAGILQTAVSVRLIFDGGSCSVNPSDPTKGPDGIPCTPDDQPAPGKTKLILPGVFTGTARTVLSNANNDPVAEIGPGETCGSAPCQAEISGRLFDCDQILASQTGGLDSGEVILAFPGLDVYQEGGQRIGDSVVTVRLTPRKPCTGDCSADDTVSVDELVTGVGIALGAVPFDDCIVFDQDGDANVSIDELIGAIHNSAEGCFSEAGATAN